ncbi:MAG: efflux RND transporter periplasmic adaptor subunit [Planctomycetota bacterium]|jgi:RND family efflux transporter MFP subunit|nr:efflux RND transporter periplasmic adaptor subunit [Planctomycetota bacterium]
MSQSKPKPGKWLVLPPIAVAVGLFAILVRGQKEPERVPEKENVRALRVIRAPKVAVVPRVLGYGIATPGQIWKAVSEVRGRVVEAHEELDSGMIIKKGVELLKIDPQEYELAAARLRANISQANAQLAELATQGQNNRASLEIEKRSLGLAEDSLKRRKELLSKNAISQDDVDREERGVLQQRQSIQKLENSLKLIPAQRDSLAAALKVHEANLKQAELDLKKVVIKAPFDCRLGEVNIEIGQFLAAGQTLFEAHSLAVTEVEAQFPAGRLGILLSPEARKNFHPGLNMKQVRKLFNIEARVRVRVGEFFAEWDATFARIREAVDPQTRTFPVVVAVAEPYKQVIPGKRPPLTKGMFCQVELRSLGSIERVIIPRDALHHDKVYVVNDENRLESRDVKVVFEQSGFVCLESGLNEGERIIVSDPVPAIEGMLIAPTEDEQLRATVLAQANGERPLK